MNRDRRAANYLFIFYAVLSVSALGAPLSAPIQSFKGYLAYVVNPMLFVGARAQQHFAGMPTSIAHLISTDVENRELREEMKRVPQMEAEIDFLRHENDRLKAELSMKPSTLRISRWARVMERDPFNWYRSLLIDAGKDDGVEVNSPVLGLSSGTLGAIGRITEVGPSWSKVLLLADEVSSIAAYLPDSSWEGLVEGQGSGILRMNYLSMRAQISLGDRVNTSATSVTFPPDILIGTVTKIFQQDPFLTFQSVGVTPAIDAGILQEVLILSPQKMNLVPRFPAKSKLGKALSAIPLGGAEAGHKK